MLGPMKMVHLVVLAILALSEIVLRSNWLLRTLKWEGPGKRLNVLTLAKTRLAVLNSG